MAREQELINIMFEVSLTINSKRAYFDGKSNEEIAAWVAEQLRGCGFDTQPVGSSWGYLKKT
jgi:hypothetical protein